MIKELWRSLRRIPEDEEEPEATTENIMQVRFQWGGEDGKPPCFIQKSMRPGMLPRTGDTVHVLCMNLNIVGRVADVCWTVFDSEPQWEYWADEDGLGTLTRASARANVMLQDTKFEKMESNSWRKEKP